MKYYLALLLFVLTCTQAVAGDKDGCRKFHNGKFVVEDPSATVYIERKGNRQIETIPSAKQKIELEVKWIDECTYTLRFLRMIEGVLDNPDRKNIVLRCSIGQLLEHGYTLHCTSDQVPGMDMKFEVKQVLKD